MHIIGSQADTRFYTKGVPMLNNSLFISQYGIGVLNSDPPIYKRRGGEISKRGKYRGRTTSIHPPSIGSCHSGIITRIRDLLTSLP